MFTTGSCLRLFRSRLPVLFCNVGRELPARTFSTNLGITKGISPGSSLASSSSILSCGAGPVLNSGLLQPSSSALLTSVRTITRIFFPRPRENKRLGKYSWHTRMQTRGGRWIIMRRILKGRHSLTHG